MLKHVTYWIIFVALFLGGCKQSVNTAKEAENFYAQLIGDDTCCLEVRMKMEHFTLQWIKTLAPEKRPAQYALLDTGFHWYRGKFLEYKRADSLQATFVYDSFITTLKQEKDVWQNIVATLAFVYENAREGDYHTQEIEKLHSGKEKYIAYALDKVSGICGDYAAFTADILNEAGILSGSLLLSGTTQNGNSVPLHIVTIAILNDKAYILDPEFGRYYGLKNNPNVAADYVSMYHHITQGKVDEIINIEVPHGEGKVLNYDCCNRGSCTNDTSRKMYLVAPSLIREDGGAIDVKFSEPSRFPMSVDSLIYENGLPLNYYSFFVFPNEAIGSQEFVNAFQKIIRQAEIQWTKNNSEFR